MKKIDIIKGLCKMGNTEGVGVFTTPAESIPDFIREMFGESVESISGEEIDLEPNTDYIYSYDDLISNRLATELILVDDREIFIYDIED